MKRTMTLLAAAVLAAHAAHAQYVTYNHDSPKQNQITVMETGAGSLSPDLYYLLLHNKYKKTAAAKNKLSFRTLAGVNLYNQTDEAEAIDSALVKRAGIEALNIADRQVDLAWLAEGDKVDGQMERFRSNIDRILLCGGTPDERSIIRCTGAPSTPPRTPTCPTPSGRRNTCASARMLPGRTRRLCSISPEGRTPP